MSLYHNVVNNNVGDIVGKCDQPVNPSHSKNHKLEHPKPRKRSELYKFISSILSDEFTDFNGTIFYKSWQKLSPENLFCMAVSN